MEPDEYLTRKEVQHVRITQTALGATNDFPLLSGGPQTVKLRSESIDQHLSQDERRAVEECIKQLKGWTNFSLNDCSVAALSGGLTNIIWLVKAPANVKLDSGVEPAVVVRQFGKGTEAIIDRDKEAMIYKVFASVGVGPRILGHFQGGRIEQFFPATRINCKQQRDPEVMGQIATMLGRIHAADAPSLQGREMAGERIVADLRSWAEKAENTEFPQDADKQTRLANLQVNEMLEEMEVLIDALANIDSQITLCHNDLHEGNILVNDDGSKKLYLIDFEYSGWGPRGFDIGNHFCEMSVDNFSDEPLGFKYSSADYPKKEQQDMFFKNYLLAQGKSSSDKGFDQEMEKLFQEANMYALLSHFKWALWGIACAPTSDIEFDFLAFAQTRLFAYYERKAACTRLRLWPEPSRQLEAKLEVMRKKKLKWKVLAFGIFGWGTVSSIMMAIVAFRYRGPLMTILLPQSLHSTLQRRMPFIVGK